MIGLVGDRYITRSLEVYGEFSGAEWALFAQVVKPGMTVVEVGANIGAHSVPLARACFPTGTPPPYSDRTISTAWARTLSAISFR